MRFEKPIVRRYKDDKRVFYDYYRVDLKTGNTTKLKTYNPGRYSLYEFKLSPDGNFTVSPLGKFGRLYTIKGDVYEPHGTCFTVYAHSKGEKFSIRHVPGWIRDIDIDNQGDVVSKRLESVFTLKYKNGTYVWATDREKQPKYFSVTKYKLEDNKNEK